MPWAAPQDDMTGLRMTFSGGSATKKRSINEMKTFYGVSEPSLIICYSENLTAESTTCGKILTILVKIGGYPYDREP
jgi:hypothetical protein